MVPNFLYSIIYYFFNISKQNFIIIFFIEMILWKIENSLFIFFYENFIYENFHQLKVLSDCNNFFHKVASNLEEQNCRLTFSVA